MGDTKQRLAYIDALRGFAILGVIITHIASYAGVSGSLRKLTDAGGNGVLLFFVISACTIFMTLTSGVKRDSRPFRNFFIKRLMRLLPVYWLGIVLYTAVYGLGPRAWRVAPELWHYPLHITLTNLLWPTTTSSVVPGGWSISCEAIFYLTVPLWFALIRNWKAAAIMVVACIIGGPVIVKVLQMVVNPLFAGISDDLIVQYWYRSFPSMLGVFAFGILLWFFVTERPAFVGWLKHPLLNCVIIGIATLILLVAAFKGVPFVRKQYLYGLGFMLWGVTLSQIPWRLFVNRATVFVGRISYSGYIFHFVVYLEVGRLLPRGAMTPIEYAGMLAVLVIPITLIMAKLGHKFIEEPTTKWANAWVRKLEGKPSATSVQQELQTAP